MPKTAKKARTVHAGSHGTRKDKGSAPFWHPLLHRRFGEELFYFLIAVKPYDPIKAFDALHMAMDQFRISTYCAYQVFGQFDMLVRVWLPAGQSQDFVNVVIEQMSNLHSIIEFHVSRTSEDWRFHEQLNEEANELAASITPQQIRSIQNGEEPGLVRELKKEGIYKVVKDYLSKNPKSTKAFIAISEPTGASRDKRDAIFRKVVERVNSIPNSDQRTVYLGYGFAWSLVKVVFEDYYAIGRLVDSLLADLKGEGVSTSTYLVASENYREGECIGQRALENKEGDQSVRLFLPELYSTSDLDDEFKLALESFVKTRVVGVNALDFADKLALQGFLRAVILNSPIDAFTALFPTFVQTEQALRQLLFRAADKTDHKLQGLVHAIDPEKKHIKNVKTMSMAMVLKGCTYLVKKSNIEATLAFDDIPEHLVDSLTSARNRIMHGSEFDPRSEWRLFAEALVQLVRVRSQLTQHLTKYEQKQTHPSDAETI